MKNVSNEFRKTMNTRTDFYMESDVVFADGTEKELTRENFYLSGNSYTDAAGSSSFPLGVALEKQIQISLVNDKDQFSEYDFYGAEFTVFCCLDLNSGTTEKILLGTFTVTEPETYGSIITVNAVDDMYKGDKDYSTGLTFPMTAGQALRDSCSTCGVTLLDTTFTNDDYVIAEMPEGITHRALWGQCAMLAGGNARMDEYNRLRIISYDFSLFDRAGLNGGVFDVDTPYSSGDVADGGTFNPWDTGDVVDGGTFIEAKDYHVFWKAKNLTVATDDVVITGVQTTIDEETYRFGEEGYILSLTNQLIEGNPQDAVNRIGALIVGARFRPFSMDHTAYPLAEVGDVCFVVDRKQNTYQAIVTDVNFTFFGFTTLQCQADNPIRNSSKYNSQLTQAIVQSRLNTEKQISEYDKAVQQLTSLITQSFGVYKTEEVLDDGSTIYYMHNKPTLAESQTIWKMTADAFAVSTDGGQTWNAGMDSSGNAVVNVLSAIGINAEWVDVQDLSAFNATIGGWDIGNTQIVKYIDLYDDMSSSGLANVGANDPVQYWVWMRAPTAANTACFVTAYKRKSDYLSGNNVVYTNFSARADGNVRMTDADILGGTLQVGSLFSVDSDGNVVANSLKSNNAIITGGELNINSQTARQVNITLKYDNGGNANTETTIGAFGFESLDINGLVYASTTSQTLECGDVTQTEHGLTGRSSNFQAKASGQIKSVYTYNDITTSPANMVVDNGGYFCRSSSSSKRYKRNISEKITESLNPERLYEIPVKSFKYRKGYLHEGDPRENTEIIGLIVEDLEEKYPCAVEYDAEGNPEMWNAQILIPAMLKLIQEQNERIKKLEETIVEKG